MEETLARLMHADAVSCSPSAGINPTAGPVSRKTGGACVFYTPRFHLCNTRDSE